MEATIKEKKSLRELFGSFSVIKPYLSRHKGKITLLLILSLITSAIAPLQGYIFSVLIESVSLSEAQFFGVTMSALSLVVIWGVSLVFELVFSWKASTTNMEFLEKTLRLFVLDFSRHVLRLPLSFHKKRNTSDIMEKVSQMRADLYELFLSVITDFGPSILTMLISVGIIYFYSPLLFMITVTSAIIYLSIVIVTTPKVATLQKTNRAAWRKSSKLLHESIEHYRSIKDFQTEEFEYQRAKGQYFSDAIPKWLNYFRFNSRTNLLLSSIAAVTRIILFVVSLTFFQSGIFSLATIIFVNTLIGMVFRPLKDVSRIFRFFQSSFTSLLDIKEILETPEEIYDPKKSQSDIRVRGNMIFNDVSFDYGEGQKILSNISFGVNAGEVVALVGESGVGKSTLVNLISGYYFPTEGELTIDGISIREISLSALRRAISVVPQEPALFNETIRYNLAYGSEVTDEKILEEAARKAHCLEFIEKMPQKWETLVGDRGVRLSVGQKQRIAIARAILRDPKILILDEPTSALDAGSEKIVVSALEELMTGRSTFIIAHRLSTVRKANKIIVFKDGKIVEIGSHEELLQNQGGEYKRLHDLQIGIHE